MQMQILIGGVRKILKLKIATISILVGIWLSGCATGVDRVKLYDPLTYEPPKESGASVAHAAIQDIKPKPDNKISFAIRKVKDARPDISSIGIKKNGYGMAMGKVDLYESVTLPEVFKQNLINCFTTAGYEILPAKAGKNDADALVDVDIRSFWVEFMPGFFLVDADSNVIFEVRLISPQTNQELWSETYRGKGKVSSGLAITKEMFEQSINIAYADAMRNFYLALADENFRHAIGK